MAAETKSPLYPDWAQLPSQIKEALSEGENCRLWDSNGLLAFRYSSAQHRTHMIVNTLRELADKIDTGRDHGVAAAYLSNFLAHSVSLYLRRPGDLQTRDFYVADERHHVHRLVSSMDALQTLCDAMNDLVQVIDSELLHDASPTAHRLNMETLKDQLRSSPTKEKSSIKEKIHFSTQILAVRAMFTSNINKQSIAREFLNKMTADCLKRGKYLVLNSEHTHWLPMSNGFDLNLHTLETRRRWLDYHLVGLCTAVSTIQPEDAMIKRLSELDRVRLFGKIPSLIFQLAAGNEGRAQSIVVSLYLQLLGHNKHKYLIIYMGDGHNGKSLLLTLLRESLGELCAPLHKSILFGGGGQKDLHSGFQIQLDSIRSGIMDDLGPRDTFNEQAIKMIVSPDVELVMREAGHTRRGASKARYRIGCSLLLCCNYGSMPKIQMDQALVNRFRIIPFEANFTHQPPRHKEEGKAYYKAEPGLLDQLKKPTNLTFFLNYVIMAGRYYYQQNIVKFGEPLVNESKIQAQLESSLEAGSSALPSSSNGLILKSNNNFKDWWENSLVYEPGQSVAIGTLAIAYSKTTGIVLRNPAKDFGQLLQSHYPEIARDKKKQLMTEVEGIRSKRMTILDYMLLEELEC